MVLSQFVGWNRVVSLSGYSKLVRISFSRAMPGVLGYPAPQSTTAMNVMRV
jgi:hypothetical protein